MPQIKAPRNKTIEVSIKHGGDAGGAYYSCKEEIFKEVNNLVKLIDKGNKLEVVWNNEYEEEQPIIRLAEIEKLYELAGVEKERMCEWTCKGSECCSTLCEHYESTKEYYPPFTAEKQLEIIKLLSNLTIKIVRFDNCFYVGTKFEHCKEYDGCFAGCEKIEFTEALAGLINNLWQDLTKIEQEEIRKILKGEFTK